MNRSSESSRGGRIPVKVHRRVALVKTNEPILAEELIARKTLARNLQARLSPTVLLVRPEGEQMLLDELRRMGHAPRVARAGNETEAGSR